MVPGVYASLLAGWARRCAYATGLDLRLDKALEHHHPYERQFGQGHQRVNA
jgi:hypothetical protein